jgi:hypothetical protein
MHGTGIIMDLQVYKEPSTLTEGLLVTLKSLSTDEKQFSISSRLSRYE